MRPHPGVDPRGSMAGRPPLAFPVGPIAGAGRVNLSGSGAREMSRIGWVSAVAMVVTIGLITLALFIEAGSGPTFRAGDHDSYRECIRNIPAEWGPGSLQRSGAEDACHYVHRPVPSR